MDNAANIPQVDCGHEEHPDTGPVDALEAIGEIAGDEKTEDGSELRAAQRYTLLIRAAKLVTSQGEFVCILRDVSESGLSVRLFHRVPTGEPIELHMPGGGVYELRLVWERRNEAGFEFVSNVDVARLINEAGTYPKRGLRLGVFFPIKLRTLTGRFEGVVENLSQQGARFECDGLFAIDQTLTLESPEAGGEFFDIRVKVRWRRDHEYGVVFENTLSLRDFARLAARLQCPKVLD